MPLGVLYLNELGKQHVALFKSRVIQILYHLEKEGIIIMAGLLNAKATNLTEHTSYYLDRDIKYFQQWDHAHITNKTESTKIRQIKLEECISEFITHMKESIQSMAYYHDNHSTENPIVHRIIMLLYFGNYILPNLAIIIQALHRIIRFPAQPRDETYHLARLHRLITSLIFGILTRTSKLDRISFPPT
jgi:hypothetical protein